MIPQDLDRTIRRKIQEETVQAFEGLEKVDESRGAIVHSIPHRPCCQSEEFQQKLRRILREQGAEAAREHLWYYGERIFIVQGTPPTTPLPVTFLSDDLETAADDAAWLTSGWGREEIRERASRIYESMRVKDVLPKSVWPIRKAMQHYAPEDPSMQLNILAYCIECADRFGFGPIPTPPYLKQQNTGKS